MRLEIESSKAEDFMLFIELLGSKRVTLTIAPDSDSLPEQKEHPEAKG